MRIAFTGVDLMEGKIRYDDPSLMALKKKDQPEKFSPFFVEFMEDGFAKADVIVVPEEKILDLLIWDMQKLETRLEKDLPAEERELLNDCMQYLEDEIALSELEFDDAQRKLLQTTALFTMKPVVKLKGGEDQNLIIKLALEKAQYMFFYTSGPRESHAWLVRKNATALECAERIHSDLARGFIKADVVHHSDYLNHHSFNECRSKGLVQLVDREYRIDEGDVLEIRHNVTR